jgi:hypothetical protein
MTTQEAVQLWGGHTRLAKVLGITRDAIYKWGEYPPNETQYKLMVLSGGRLSVTYINEKGQNNNDE